MITPRSSPTGSSAWMRAANLESTLKVPIRFTLTMAENFASGSGLPSRSMTLAGGPMPAQLTRIRALPLRPSASAMAFVTSSSSVTFTLWNVPPMAFAFSVPRSSLRSKMATLAPFAASISAVAPPSPEAPPVTMAASPSICIRCVSSPCRGRCGRRLGETDGAPCGSGEDR